MLAAAPDGTIVGVYAGLGHRAILDGEDCLAGLHIDVCVDRERRRGVAGARLLISLMRRYFHTHAGGEVRLTWGYPEPALQRIGLRFVRFHVLRDVVFLVRDSAACCAAPTTLSLRRVERFGPDVDGLWDRCRNEVRTGTVRDQRYLNWRYAEHPDVPHQLFEARGSDGALRAIAAAREGGWDGSLYSIMDWLAPRTDVDAEQALMAGIRDEATARGRPWIAAWIAGAPELFRRFQAEHGFLAQGTPYQECFRSWHPPATRRSLGESWYQTMGDIDFF